MTFSIYDAMESNWPVWQEGHRGVQIKNGYFRVMLNVDKDIWSGNVFLGHEVDGLHSRQAVVSFGGTGGESWVRGNLYGTYVGQTTAQYNGDLDGYAGANAKGDAEFTGSHICTTVEILMSIYEGMTVGDGLIAGGVYIKDLRIGGTEIFSDCDGFTTNTDDKHCTIWFGGGFTHPGGMRCSEVHSLLCCK